MSESGDLDRLEPTREKRLSHPAAELTTLRLSSAQLLADLRQLFDEQGYFGVETPILSHDVLVDAYLEPFSTRWYRGRVPDAAAADSKLFLQTSPEFGMKRLLAAGADSIYQITRAMRNGELGQFHNPEFTMIEWYRVGDTYQRQMGFVEDLVKRAYSRVLESNPVDDEHSAGRRQFANQVLESSFQRLAYDDAFERYAGTRVLDRGTSDLPKIAESHGLAALPSLGLDDRDGWH